MSGDVRIGPFAEFVGEAFGKALDGGFGCVVRSVTPFIGVSECGMCWKGEEHTGDL
jgi:hypothetical protein